LINLEEFILSVNIIMEDHDETEPEVPLTKQKVKRHYEKTPAREESIQKMREARLKSIEMNKAQKVLQASKTMEKYEKPALKQDQPPAKKAPVKKVVEQVVEDDDDDDDDDEPVIVVRKKKKKQPKIIIEEESDEEEEPQIIKKKKTPAPAPEKKSSVLKVSQPPQAEKPQSDKPIDYRSFFA
jgi:hypothetical protein